MLENASIYNNKKIQHTVVNKLTPPFNIVYKRQFIPRLHLNHNTLAPIKLIKLDQITYLIDDPFIFKVELPIHQELTLSPIFF